jgi:multidrug efflux pump subunit AcrB
MKLPKLAIENHQFTSVVITLLLLFGIASFISMPRSEDPRVSPPGSSIFVVYPGANPKDIEELVVDPIEKVINELDDIYKLTSLSEDGLGSIFVEFYTGTDSDEKYSDVVQKVNSIRDELPEEILFLEMEKWSITDVNILQLALISDTAPYRDMQHEAERLEKMIRNRSGVRKVAIWACPDQQVTVSVDLDKIAKRHIALDQVMAAIQSTGQNIPGGSLDIASRQFNVRTSGSFETIDQIKETVVHAGNNHLITLQDIAKVKVDDQDITYKGRHNGKRAIFITLQQKDGTNIFRVLENLQAVFAEFRAELPGSMEMVSVFDQSESVSERLSVFFSSLLQGLILVGIVVFFAVGFRSSMIVMLAIPISIFMAIGIVDLSGFGIQQMTIAGLVIALGLLVDNAIVVAENTSRFIKLGYSPKQAAIEGTSQVGWAIVSATGTTVLAFVPMLAMHNMTGDFIKSMPVTVIVTLVASLMISLSLTPYLASKFITIADAQKESRVRHLLNRLIESYYRRTLAFALEKSGRFLILVLLIFLLALALFPLVGVSFFPKAEKPQLMINMYTAEGASLALTDRVARQVEAELAGMPSIRSYTSNIGHGNPRIYYNTFPKREQNNYVQIFVQLHKYKPAAFANMIQSLRQRFANIPGARIEIKEFEQGPPVEAPIAIRILGDNLSVLEDTAGDVEAIIRQTAGTVNVDNPLSESKSDLHIRIDREKAGLLGVLITDIDRTVRAAIAGLPVSQFRDEHGKEYNVVVRLPVNGRPGIEDLNEIYITSQSGAMIPLKQVSYIEFSKSPLAIDHFNMQRTVIVTADVVGKTSVNDVTRKIIKQLNAYDWPKGTTFSIGGELESREESFGGMLKAILVAMAAILGVLVLQFRSYRQPLIVFSAIPLAIIGSILALLITGNTFSFTAFIGMTSLVGIVVNNAIILVDYTNQLFRQGTDMISAIKKAGETRFMPIVLTTATTVGGLLPLTLGGGTVWAPLGWTIIGGLIASTFLTLVVVPVLYKVFTKQSV